MNHPPNYPNAFSFRLRSRPISQRIPHYSEYSIGHHLGRQHPAVTSLSQKSASYPTFDKATMDFLNQLFWYRVLYFVAFLAVQKSRLAIDGGQVFESSVCVYLILLWRKGKMK
jgi:hypothetical protein